MNSFCELLQLISSGILGLFVGALLAEGALLVPYWRTLPADKFFSLHKEYGPRLYSFYAPLTIAATMLAVTTAIVCLLTFHSGRWSSLVVGILAVLMVAIYFFYFKHANAKFAAASISAAELPIELARWAIWHWVRVAVGLLAFIASLIALGQ